MTSYKNIPQNLKPTPCPAEGRMKETACNENGVGLQLTDCRYVTNQNGVSATLCHEDESLQAQRHFHFSKTVLRLLEAFVDFAQQADADIDPKAVSALTLSLQGHSMMSIAQMLGTNNVRVSELVNTAIEQLSRVKLQMDIHHEEVARTLADIQRSFPPYCAETLARLLNTPLKCLPYNLSDAALLRAEEAGIKTLGDLCRRSRQRIAAIRGLARSMSVFDQMLRDYHSFMGFPAPTSCQTLREQGTQVSHLRLPQVRHLRTRVDGEKRSLT